jgi:hypothetical protein
MKCVYPHNPAINTSVLYRLEKAVEKEKQSVERKDTFECFTTSAVSNNNENNESTENVGRKTVWGRTLGC